MGAAAGALLGANGAIQAAQQTSQAAAAARVGTIPVETDKMKTALDSTKSAVDDAISKQKDVFDKASEEILGGPLSAAMLDCEASAGVHIPNQELQFAHEDTLKSFSSVVDSGQKGFDNTSTINDQFLEANKRLNGSSTNLFSSSGSYTSFASGLSGASSFISEGINNLGKTKDLVAKQVTEKQALSAYIENVIFNCEALQNQACATACSQALSLLENYEVENIKNMQGAVDTGTKVFEVAKENIQKAGEYMNNVSNEITQLKNEATNAENAQKGEGPKNTKVDTFNEGRFFAMEGMFAGLGFLAGGLLPGLFDATDACDERTQFNVVDWKINLKNDAKGVEIEKEGISAEWSTNEAFVFGEYESQEVGVVFSNTGIAEPKPAYGIATFSATKHVHSKPTIIKRDGKKFGQFNIPDQSIENYEQKFHLRFKTAEQEQPIPLELEGASSCVSGVNIGFSGEGAVPKVKLDWNWKQFSLGSCDIKNPGAVYCDAAQFNYEINYRLDALNEFIDKNREKLKCPENPADVLARELVEGIPQRIATGQLPATGAEGKVSLVTYTSSATGNGITVTPVVGNSSAQVQGATVKVTVTPPEGVSGESKSCQISFSGIPANGTQAKSCSVSGLAQSAQNYSVKVEILDATTEFEQKTLEFRTQVRSEISCWLPASSELYDGKPAMDYFVEEVEPQITWTQRIPDRQALNELLVFNAFLIRDGYSQDFLEDFQKYSDEIAPFDTPTFFNSFATNSAGQRYGFNSFYKNGAIAFRKKYVDGPAVLSRGGIYRVELLVNWGGDWQFFDMDGKPLATVEVLLNLLQEPSPNSPFYHLPFDGLLGIERDNSFERQGYGTSFVKENEEDVIALNSSPPIVKTFGSTSSNALLDASVEFKEDLFSLNVNPLLRGNILSIESTGTNASIKFFPAVATPVMLKMHSEQRTAPFGAFYGMIENENRANIGEVLSYWSGAGACLDFSGTAVTDAFDESPDRKAQPEDGIANFENNYTVQWAEAIREGDVFLKTIFFTNPQQLNDLVVEAPKGNLTFLTPDEGPKDTVSLNGINSMEFNNKAKALSAIEDVFDLVKTAQLCTTSTGNKVTFWWNP
ncbi:MAG: hypothetical protein HYW50_04530, partial [Candidatus Diapherotrites archaeon]|nr:hypothetical protein [Candidatus Diapherotrites archaeon]